MKLFNPKYLLKAVGVAPFAGAWIEITNTSGTAGGYKVAPFAGAWIEMTKLLLRFSRTFRSLPSRERGLKFPAVGKYGDYDGRSLRGSVD